MSFATLTAAFRNRNYAIYISGNWLSLIGFWMQQIAVDWLTWDYTHSEFWVGAVGFAEVVPLVVVGPLFGVWADRFDRRKLAMWIQSLMLIQAVLLFSLLELGWVNIGVLFVMTAIEGSLQAAFQPVRLALIPNLVAKEDLVAASAFTSVTFNVARFLGPAIAGVVIVWSSPAWAILVNGISYLFIVIAWYFIDIPPHDHARRPSAGLVRGLIDGFRYVAHEKALALLFGLLMLLALFARPVTYMLAAFVGAIFHKGPETLALFTSAVGAGAVVAGFQLSLLGRTAGLVRFILWNSWLSLLSLFGFVIVTNEWLASALMFGFGYSVTACAATGQTLVQNSIDDAMRGRVLSLWVAATRGPPALGLLVLGSLGSRYGLEWPFIGSGLLCLAGLVWLARGKQTMQRFFERDD
ncbi:MAG TPA: MFS transporter [Candidatus Acidoferrum sp.]|nr:MFS transporter [Candidatus Acidoferrum sp.]